MTSTFPSFPAAATGPRHIPVMLAEVLHALQPRDGEVYIDGTFGAGGYSSAILAAANCQVLAFDRDPSAVRAAMAVCERFPDRLTVVETPFAAMEEVARVYLGRDDPATGEYIAPPIDGVVLDIGVSSMQIDEPERGFSFQSDGPLDMRMSAGSEMAGPSAADVVNSAREEHIASILFHLGEERRSRTIARAIVKDRTQKSFTRTSELAGLVFRVLGGRKEDGRHPATRTFQALRIYVNDELGQLAAGLSAAERILRPGGRLVVVSFHSLEDRIVKRFLAERGGRLPAGSRHMPAKNSASPPPSFRIINLSPLTPSKGESEVNPRSRSARLRAALRTEAAPFELNPEALGLPVLDR